MKHFDRHEKGDKSVKNFDFNWKWYLENSYWKALIWQEWSWKCKNFDFNCKGYFETNDINDLIGTRMEMDMI